MKRSTMLALTGVMTMFLGACGDNTPPKPVAATTTTTTITSPAPAAEEDKTGDKSPEVRAEETVAGQYQAAQAAIAGANADDTEEQAAEIAPTSPSVEDAPRNAEMPST